MAVGPARDLAELSCCSLVGDTVPDVPLSTACLPLSPDVFTVITLAHVLEQEGFATAFVFPKRQES